MKAIQVKAFGGPEVMRLETVEDPKAGRGQVVVVAKAIGVNPVDTYIRAGAYPRKPELPYTPGYDGAGIVEGTSRRVYFAGCLSGAYAEKVLCEEAKVYPLPEKLSFAQGAAIGVPYGTAYRSLFIRARASAGDTVLVHGASGGVGLAGVQLARAAGMTVIGTAGTKRGLDLVLAQGAHHALDHKAPDYLEKLKSLTGGRGVDVILEMLANVNLAKDLGVLATGGRVVVIGSRGTVEIDPRMTMGQDSSILGMTLAHAGPEEYRMIHAALGAGFENGSLRPVVGRELLLSEASQAHQAVMEPGAYGKIVLIP